MRPHPDDARASAPARQLRPTRRRRQSARAASLDAPSLCSRRCAGPHVHAALRHLLRGQLAALHAGRAAAALAGAPAGAPAARQPRSRAPSRGPARRRQRRWHRAAVGCARASSSIERAAVLVSSAAALPAATTTRTPRRCAACARSVACTSSGACARCACAARVRTAATSACASPSPPSLGLSEPKAPRPTRRGLSSASTQSSHEAPPTLPFVSPRRAKVWGLPKGFDI